MDKECQTLTWLDCDSELVGTNRITLACQLESFESVQKSFQAVKTAASVTVSVAPAEAAGTALLPSARNNSYQDLVAQVASLSEQLSKLRLDKGGKCPARAKKRPLYSDERSAKHTSAIASTLTLKGFVVGHPVPMLVDTGSSVTLLHESVWKEAVKNSKLELKQARCPVMAVNVYTPQQVNKYALNLRTQLETAYEWIRGHMELQQRRQKALYDKATNGIHSRDSPRKRAIVHFDRLKPHVALPQSEEEVTPVEEPQPQADGDDTSVEEDDGYYKRESQMMTMMSWRS
ncbi:hypothetical protein EMCRGX_G028025 [Ephydatia muelleri]